MRQSAGMRWLYAVSSLLAMVAAGGRLLTSGMPKSALRAEALLLGLALLFVAVVVRLRVSRHASSFWVQSAMNAVSIGFAVGFLAIAAPYLPDIVPLTAVVFAFIFLASDMTLERRLLLAAVGLPTVGLVAIWVYELAILHEAPAVLAVWGGLLVALLVLAYVDWRILEDRTGTQVTRLHAIANAVQRVGLATDYTTVARAVLEAARDSYPAANSGGILLFNPASGKLRSLPVALHDGGVSEVAGQQFDLAPGEALAGNAYLTGQAQAWSTAAEAKVGHASLAGDRRLRIREAAGDIKSAVAAPLRTPDRGVIGVLTLGSSSRESVFRPDDVTIVQGLADQAALGIERARLFQEQRTQALTDPLTGLSNYRQLQTVLAQEVARAKRASEQMALLFCDLDGFKEVNDVYGHQVGDAVLRLFALVVGETLRAGDTAARYGGDEFVCVLPGADAGMAGHVGERLRHAFSEALANQPVLSRVQTAVSVGVAVFPDHGDQPLSLLNAADAALLADKRRAEGVTRRPSPELHVVQPRHAGSAPGEPGVVESSAG